MAERGLLRIEKGEARQTAPVFDGEDGKVLRPAIDAVVARLMAEMMPGTFEDVEAFLVERGFGSVRENFPPYHDLAWEGFTHAMLDKGVLERPGRPVRKGWGLFAWTEGFGPMAEGW